MSIWEGIKKRFRDTFGPDGIFSTGQEGHAFLLGISETIAFRKPRFDMPEDYEAYRIIKQLPGNPLYEYHYYVFGRACGIIFWVFVIIPCFCLIMKAIWG